MYKKLKKAYAKNVRLDKPCGLIGVPPDTYKNVVIVARLSDSQYANLIRTIGDENFFSKTAQGGVTS